MNIPQTWNNCGPASLAEVLAYWGVYRTQGQIQAVLRVDGPARGMTPYGVPGYARSVGLRALVGVGGTEALVKALVSNGFPVIVSQQVSVSNRIGHYRPIEAYDNAQSVFVASDPYLGAGYRITYADFAQIWASSDHGFMVLYSPARQAMVTAVLAAAGWDKRRAYQHDLALAQARLRGMSRRTATQHAVMMGWSTHGRGYGYLRLAWDELQLGHAAAARRALAQAARQGANPIEVGWISQEITRQGAA
jgi:predicted double-glycine peptidase